MEQKQGGGISPHLTTGKEKKMTTTLTDAETMEMILRGIEAKIDETLESAERAKMTGNLRQWANYLSVAARWADKLVETNTAINTEKAGI